MVSAAQLGEFGLFADMDAEQRDRVARGAAWDVCFAAGQRLFEEGHAARGCWLVQSGQVTLDATVPGRGQVVIQTLGSGDIVGWSWLVPPYRWQFGARATEPTTAIELDTDQLRALAEREPALGYHLALRLMEALLNRLQATRARLLDLYGSPRAR